MNNWRLLLLAVVAVLQPIGSFTERNLIDGRQECCDHRSNSFAEETRLYGNSRKNTPEDRRLISQDIREDRRRTDARTDPIRARERLTVESTERRVTPEAAVRFSTETRFTRDQDRRQRSRDARESRVTREDQSRRIRESVSRDSLSRYERDALDSRRIRMSRDDTRVGRVSNERVYRESFGSPDIRKVRDSKDFRRASVTRETVADRRGRDVARDDSHRDSRIGSFRAENRLQLDSYRERHNLGGRVRENGEENRRSRSLESRVNSVERDNRRTGFRTISERVDERRQREQNRESRDRTIATLRGSFERVFAERRRELRDAMERLDQSRRNIREYRTDERIDIQRQHRDDSRLSRERSSERRETRLNAERSQPLSRESRILAVNVRSERIVRSNERIDGRREVTRDVLRVSRDSNDERRQNSRAPLSETTATVFRTLKSHESRDERRQPLTRSLDRVRSDERDFNARITERKARDERAIRHHRDVRSEERLDERREQRYESRMSMDRQNSVRRESRDSAERRQETRSVSPSQFEVNARSERESRLRERDNVRSDIHRDREERRLSREQTVNRMARETERRHDSQIFRTSRFTERDSRAREETDRERHDVHREARDNRVRIVMQRPNRHVSAPQRKSDTRRFESNGRLQRARTLEDIRDDRRVTERDESRSIDRVSMSRLSRARIESREARETARDARDVRNEIIRNRGVRMTEKSESRRQEDSRSQDRVLQRQTRDILAARSVERRSRELERREARETATDSRNIRNEIIRNRDVRMTEKSESRRQEDSRSQDRVLQRQTRDILAARSVERRSRELGSRDVETRSERLSRSSDERRVSERDARNSREFRTVESRRESRRMTESEVQPNRHNLAMKSLDRTANRHDIRIEAKLRSSDVVLTENIRADTRREARDTRFRIFESKFREMDPIDTSDNQNAMSWQMVFYTLQGAYLCGLLMQMLTEKSNKENRATSQLGGLLLLRIL